MSETKHTPGPWHVYKGHGLYVDSSSAGSVCKVAEKRASEQQVANAHLIAAAPDMLEALIIALPWLSENEVPSLVAKKIAEAAIRKAKGE